MEENARNQFEDEIQMNCGALHPKGSVFGVSAVRS
jgi:hypothetical protein